MTEPAGMTRDDAIERWWAATPENKLELIQSLTEVVSNRVLLRLARRQEPFTGS